MKSSKEQPRIINIYNFIRAVEPRDEKVTHDVLWQTTANQIAQLKQYQLPATFALQYDALIEPCYQKLLKEQLDERDEIAAWWEIVQPQVEKADLRWRGRYPWDWHADVGFSTGYTPAEREKLVDVYMAEFKKIFGQYPRTVGSWFIDEHTLAYLAGRYGVIASCNCKDQVGTDGYTLWGGYWNQAYYPSRVNSYMPAQNEKNQIPIPVFRMLGSDPIYQYDEGLGKDRQGVISLEPVYAGSSGGGGDAGWVKWFLDELVTEPSLAFGYTQAGQENSFTWEKMVRGLEIQVPLIAELARAGKVRVETLEQTGKWFRSRFPVTPATAVVAMQDWRNEGRKTVWYNSRFYRINLLWEPEGFRIRDIHLFQEQYASPYQDKPLTSSSCTYDTLPVMDGFLWSTGTEKAGIRLVEIKPDGKRVLCPVGAPEVREFNDSELSITCPVSPEGSLDIICREDMLHVEVKGVSASWKWGMELTWNGDGKGPSAQAVGRGTLLFEHNGYAYHLHCETGSCEWNAGQKSGLFRSDQCSRLILNMRG